MPVTVTVVGPPVVAELLADSVNVLDAVAGFELKDAVTPLGSVEVTARFTLPLNPAVGLTVIVLVLLLPCATLKLLGVADNT